VIAGIIAGKEHLAAGTVHTAESQQECQSDWEYLAHEGDICFWSTVCFLLEAAQIVGENLLLEIRSINAVSPSWSAAQPSKLGVSRS